jgi:hypothetical protein
MTNAARTPESSEVFSGTIRCDDRRTVATEKGLARTYNFVN